MTHPEALSFKGGGLSLVVASTFILDSIWLTLLYLPKRLFLHFLMTGHMIATSSPKEASFQILFQVNKNPLPLMMFIQHN